jgi:riboflavin synthase
MFTGIVEETGTIAAIRPGEGAIRLAVKVRKVAGGTKTGDSIAVNGCCLTVVKRRRAGKSVVLEFDLLRETWDRTSLSTARVGAAVNLERALAAGDRFGGHFVTGHIDGTGTITRWEQVGDDHVLEVSAPAAVRRYLVFKGSVTVDGISLTVAAVTRRGFRAMIIPHTRAVTVLRERTVGDPVNLEADMLGKYVARYVGKGEPGSRRTS